MIKTRILPIFLAAVLTVCANTTALSATVYAAEQGNQVSTDDSTDDSTGQNTDNSEPDHTVEASSSSEQDKKEDSQKQAAGSGDEKTEGKATGADQSDAVKEPEAAGQQEKDSKQREEKTEQPEAAEQSEKKAEKPEAEGQSAGDSKQREDKAEQPEAAEQSEEGTEQPAATDKKGADGTSAYKTTASGAQANRAAGSGNADTVLPAGKSIENEPAAGKSLANEPAAKNPTVNDLADGTSTAEEHHLAFASDYHGKQGSIQNAMSDMPEDVEYVSLIGDMVGDRGDFYPAYKSEEILNVVKEVFPELDSNSFSIVWATHDRNVDDEGTGIVKCMDGVSELIREGLNKDSSPAYYIFGISHFDMTNERATSADAAAAFKKWVNGVNHTIPVIVLCHVPIQASRGDNNGASYWNEALNYAATGVEGITTTDTTADIIRNVLFLHGHNHTNDPPEYYFGAGTKMSVQVDKSTERLPEGEHPSFPEGERPSPWWRAEGVDSNIYYTSLTAGYLKTNSDATLVTVADGALSLTKYYGDQHVSLGIDGLTKEPVGNSITIAAQRHTEGEGVREIIAEATCDHGGSYDLVFCCTVCGEELVRTHVLTEAAGHKWGQWTVTREATETAEGEENRTCSVCGKTETRPIPAASPENIVDPGSPEKPGDPEKPEEPIISPEKPEKPDKPKNPEQSDEKSGSSGASGQSTNVTRPGTAASPKTGDESLWILWMAIMLMSMISLAGATNMRKSRQ